ncbi:MAG: hypothetical protein V9F00_00085 [Nocardioides sp.]
MILDEAAVSSVRASVMCSTAATNRPSRVGKLVLRRPLDTPARSATTLTVPPDQPTSAKYQTAACNNASGVARLRSCFGPFSEGSVLVMPPARRPPQRDPRLRS